MTDQSQTVRTEQSRSRRQQRAHRILDAAGELILRWGYNKTTIDDVARQAGVAKGTIYLHWKTREDLFIALMQREKVALAEDLKQRVGAEPADATLRGLLKHSALALMQRPLLKAVLLGDMEVVGKLAHQQHGSPAFAGRLAGFTTYLEFLREHGLVRTDLSMRVQVYMVSAIFMGFFLVAPLMPDGWTLSDEELAELMAETVHCTLESPQPAAPDQLARAGQAFMQYLDRSTALAQQQFQQGLAG